MEGVIAAVNQIFCNVETVYVGIGCEVSKPESIDQQFPPYLSRYTTASPGKEQQQKKAVAFLFDPKFYLGPPLFIQLANDSHEWVQTDKNAWQNGNLTVYSFPHYFEKSAKFYIPFYQLLQKFIKSHVHVFIGVFTQPYLRVEENREVIDMYHELLSEAVNTSCTKYLHYYHLAAYAMDCPERGTRVWVLNGKPHDQDVALLKEVTRYKGPGPSFGVGCYAAFPGKRFQIRNPSTGAIDYNYIQKQVEELEASHANPAVILEEDEYYINQLEQFIT